MIRPIRQVATSLTRVSPSRYHTVTLLGLAAAIAQTALGGIVRVTGSGDACPDWPLCHGQIIPPLDPNVWIEFGHRLSASALGILVLLAAFLAWRQMRRVRPALAATGVSLALVVAAAVLGGLTVLSELSWWIRLIHLLLAELLVASIAVAYLVGAPTLADPLSTGGDPSGAKPRSGALLGWVALFAVLGVILYGSYMVGANYGGSCTSWPMCQGLGIPDGSAFLVNMGHRVTTVFAAALIIWACARAWRLGAEMGQLRWLAALTIGFLATELLVGAAIVWFDFAAVLRSFHLTFATLVWAATVAMIVIMFDPSRFRIPTFAAEQTSGCT